MKCNIKIYNDKLKRIKEKQNNNNDLDNIIESANYITLKQIAEKLNMDRSNACKYIKKLGYTFKKVRNRESGNQIVNAISFDIAKKILKKRQKEFLI